MNALNKILSRSPATLLAEMPNLVPFLRFEKKAVNPITETLQHPRNFPLVATKAPLWERLYGAVAPSTAGSGVALRFFVGNRFSPGATINVRIPVRHRTYKFRAKVLSAKRDRLGYSVVARVSSPRAMELLRVVEKICVLETQLA